MTAYTLTVTTQTVPVTVARCRMIYTKFKKFKRFMRYQRDRMVKKIVRNGAITF